MPEASAPIEASLSARRFSRSSSLTRERLLNTATAPSRDPKRSFRVEEEEMIGTSCPSRPFMTISIWVWASPPRAACRKRSEATDPGSVRRPQRGGLRRRARRAAQTQSSSFRGGGWKGTGFPVHTPPRAAGGYQICGGASPTHVGGSVGSCLGEATMWTKPCVRPQVHRRHLDQSSMPVQPAGTASERRVLVPDLGASAGIRGLVRGRCRSRDEIDVSRRVPMRSGQRRLWASRKE